MGCWPSVRVGLVVGIGLFAVHWQLGKFLVVKIVLLVRIGMLAGTGRVTTGLVVGTGLIAGIGLVVGTARVASTGRVGSGLVVRTGLVVETGLLAGIGRVRAVVVEGIGWNVGNGRVVRAGREIVVIFECVEIVAVVQSFYGDALLGRRADGWSCWCWGGWPSWHILYRAKCPREVS